MAFDADGKITALKVKTIANLGAYMSTFSSSVPTYLYGTLLSGQYEIPAIYCEVDAVYTNTVPVDAYRGAGRPEATFVVERLVEVGARELGIDPADLRQQELHQELPASDAGDHELRRRRLSRLAQEGAGACRLQGLRQAQARIRAPRQAARHRLLDLYRGLRDRAVPGGRLARLPAWACGNPPRCGSIRPARSRSSPAAISTARATRPPSRRSSPSGSASRSRTISVVHGDTDKVQFGMGTYGSRSGAVGISAIVKALDKVEAKAKKVAAHMLEAAEGDIVFKDGKFTVAGTDKSAAWGDVALNAYIAHKFTGAGARAGAEGGRVLRSDQLHLPGRLPHLRGRGRSRDRRQRRSWPGPRSMISAWWSIR